MRSQILCALISVRDARQMENERLFVADYMAKQYPMAEFSEPERLGEEEENRRVTEDYSQALFGFYAAQYGLEAGLAPYAADTNALFYPDIEELPASFREAYMRYMFQYESWNITTKQYREWGADLTVKEDGSGFCVSVRGKTVDFGLYPTVAFDDLLDCY